MALFFDYKLQTPLSDPNFLFFEWHSTFPLLAIASYSRNSTGQISLHFEEVRKKYLDLPKLSLLLMYIYLRVNMMMLLLYKELHHQLISYGIQKRKY
jgi:hypothetical protein